MIDIEKAKESFKKFTDKYDSLNDKIAVKISHTYRVAENAKQIAENLGLSLEEIKLAELIGLLHDIGRFEQVRIYNTFRDVDSINHAKQGIKTLFEDNYIRDFIEDDKYDNIIKVAIDNHNKFKIDDNLNKEELLHCKIIRDADKLDILNIVIKENLKTVVAFKSDDIANETLTDKVYELFKDKKLLSSSEIKTNVDVMVMWICFIFDINFKESLEIINKNQYISKLINRVQFKDEVTKKKMKEIGIIAEQYIKEKINKG